MILSISTAVPSSSALRRPAHAGWCSRLGARAGRMLTGACDPVTCHARIHVFRLAARSPGCAGSERAGRQRCRGWGSRQLQSCVHVGLRMFCAGGHPDLCDRSHWQGFRASAGAKQPRSSRAGGERELPPHDKASRRGQSQAVWSARTTQPPSTRRYLAPTPRSPLRARTAIQVVHGHAGVGSQLVGAPVPAGGPSTLRGMGAKSVPCSAGQRRGKRLPRERALRVTAPRREHGVVVMWGTVFRDVIKGALLVHEVF